MMTSSDTFVDTLNSAVHMSNVALKIAEESTKENKAERYEKS